MPTRLKSQKKNLKSAERWKNFQPKILYSMKNLSNKKQIKTFSDKKKKKTENIHYQQT